MPTDVPGADPFSGPMRSATLIGDVVDSKQHADRRGVQVAVRDALSRVNHRVPARQPLDLTIGDEFQGAYERLADALLAALLVRLELLPRIDTRFGLGFGTYEVFDRDRPIVSQDGPAWWAAREAIVRAKAVADHPRSRSLSTCVVVDRADAVPDAVPGLVDVESALNAFLVCRDETISGMSGRALRLLNGLLGGRTQTEMAQDEGITQPAVSQHLARSGAYAVQAAHVAIGGIAP